MGFGSLQFAAFVLTLISNTVVMGEYASGPVVGYQCPSCGFDTDTANCDDCDAVIKWDDEVGGTAHCTGCGREVTGITCRECGDTFSL